MQPCQVNPGSGGFVRGVLDFIDCQALSLGANGYQAMASPGSFMSQLLTALLTIFVALFGYRMLLGHRPGMRDGVQTMLKIGIVLTLATNWAAYRTLAFDLVLRSPAQLAATIGTGSDLPGANGGLVGRLDNADTMLATLAGLGAGGINRSDAPPLGSPGNGPKVFTGFDSWAIGLARLSFLVGTVGAFAGVRLIAALLLAMGPLFAGFLLFEATRGLFVGWMRALVSAALGATFIAVVLGVELALIEPWLVDLVSRRYANQGVGGVPTQLFATTLVFDTVLIGVAAAATRLVASFDLRVQPFVDLVASTFDRTIGRDTSRTLQPAMNLQREREERSRALAVADAVISAQRRETVTSGPTSGAGTNRVPGQDSLSWSNTRLGQGTRRTTARVSASARRRDRQS